MKLKYIIISLITILFMHQAVNAQDFTIHNTTSSYQNHFGWDISGSGSYCCISDPRDSISDYGNGSVSIYQKNGTQWTFYQNIHKANPTPFGLFGYQTSMSFNYLAITELGDTTKGFMSGSVSLYKLSNQTWTFMQKITPQDSSRTMYFGESLKLIGDYLFIGTSNIDSGSVFVYKLDNGLFKLKQQINSPLNRDFEFGKVLTATKDFLFVGAPATNNPNLRGSVHIYRLSNQHWISDTIFTVNQTQVGSCFGASLSSSSNTLVIGAPHTTVNNGNEEIYFSGAAYICSYTNSIWSYNPNPLINNNPNGHDLFGSKVAIKDSLIFITSPRKDIANKDDGVIYMYRYSQSNWQQDTLYSPSQSTIYFGNNIFVLNNQLIVSTGGEKQEKNKGLVFVFNIQDLINNGLNSNYKTIDGIHIYPNPAASIINISIEKNTKYKLQIYSSEGKLVKTGTIQKTTSINIDKLKSGIYIVSLESSEGIFTQRIIIQH